MPPLHIFYALLVTILWGGNFVAAKISLEHFPPVFLIALRFALTAAILVPFVTRPTRDQMRSIAVLSVLNSLHFSLPYIALANGLSIASTAITTQLGVPFSCVIGALFLNDKLGIWRTSGLIIAFSGMLIVFGAPEIESHKLPWLCALGAAFFWGIANIFTKQVKTSSMMQLLAWMSLLTAPQLLLVAFFAEPEALATLSGVPLDAALGLAYSIICSTIIAYGLWNYLLRTHPVTHVTPYSLLTPILGAIFGSIFFGETLSMEMFIGGAITIAGVAIIVIRRPKLAMLDEPV
ncbi:MAG: DMT family transporter [Alphaproteobacteria bacterium]